MVDVYRAKSARADYPAEPAARPPDGQSVAGGRPHLEQRARCDAPFIDHFDSPHPADVVEEPYRPPRWLTDARVRTSVYVIIALGMVLIFVLGFRP